MYALTFSRETIDDLWKYHSDGRQLYGAIVIPYSGIFTKKDSGSYVDVPKIVCPYQVNDILAIQEQWARTNESYMYKTGDPEKDKGFTFRPASTMPVSAARMFARIVSIRPWSITTDIINKYLTLGTNTDSYAGTAKVIGYYDKGTELLSKIRKGHNQALLNKSYQPFVTTTPPMKTVKVYYYVRNKTGDPTTFQYTCSFNNGYETYSNLKSSETSYVQARSEEKLYDGQYIDENGSMGAWSYEVENKPPVNELERNTSTRVYRGRMTDAEDGTPRYMYILKDKKGNIVPAYAMYDTKIVDPSKYLSAWLISAYLCSKDGEIIGKYF